VSHALKFTRDLSKALRNPKLINVNGLYHQLTGRFDIGAIYVSIKIIILWSFHDVKMNPPNVWCNEPWMKIGADWHNDSKNGMCWVLRQEWCDAMNWENKAVPTIIDEGQNWLLKSICCLINRHYFAHKYNLTAWPKKWDYWGHSDKGARQYEREKRLRKNS